MKFLCLRQEVGSIIEMAYAHMSKQGTDVLTGSQKEPLSDAAYARWMSEELSSVLSPQDLVLFEQYHSSLPGGMAGMYGAARETLEGSLGEQQLAIYDRYVQQQLALMKMATAVMGQPPESD